jgi:hypothetical protein
LEREFCNTKIEDLFHEDLYQSGKAEKMHSRQFNEVHCGRFLEIKCTR